MSYRIKELPIDERPRERLKQVGIKNLSNKELLSVLLKTGRKGKNVNELSLELLQKLNIKELQNVTLQELVSIKGIGEVKAMELLAAIELGKRIWLKENNKLEKLENAEKIWKDSKYLFTGLKQEYFYCYYFNNKQELIKRKKLFIGTINSATTHTREVFKEAYLLSASFIVCLHNHPSNDVEPSKADILFTKALMKTGEIQGIPVIDHIIVGENKYFSFYENPDILNL